jgi:DNA-binding response OmpR family regulator
LDNTIKPPNISLKTLPTQEVEMTAIRPIPGATKSILYIENHEDSLQMLSIVLDYAGYNVVTATNIADGMSLARLKEFDLFLLADKYSDGTAVDLCRKLRAYDADTPILFYSTLAYKSDIDAGMAAGAQHYLTKPTGISYIEQTIAGMLC